MTGVQTCALPISNWANQQAVLNVDEQKGMFEDGNAFLLQFGDTMGQILGVIATGMAGGLVIKGLGVAGRTAGMLSLSPSIGETVGMQMGLTLGSFEAIGMMQDELTKMGFSEADIARTLPAFGVAAYLAENMFNANIVQRFGPRLVNNFYGTNIPKSSLVKGIVKEYGNVVKEGVENMSDKEKTNIINSMWTKLLQKRNQLKDITTESWKARYALSGIVTGKQIGRAHV